MLASGRLNPCQLHQEVFEPRIEAGKIDIKAPITEDVLVASGLVRRKLDGIRILAKGEFKSKVTLEVTGASAGAMEAVKAAGGSITVSAPIEAAAE